MKSLQEFIIEAASYMKSIHDHCKTLFEKDPKYFDAMEFVIDFIEKMDFGTNKWFDDKNIFRYWNPNLLPDGIQCIHREYSDEAANKINDLVKEYNKKYDTKWNIEIVGYT
jgi:regulatory protein YycH of two-component signal transduction system YycFG